MVTCMMIMSIMTRMIMSVTVIVLPITMVVAGILTGPEVVGFNRAAVLEIWRLVCMRTSRVLLNFVPML